LVSLSRVMPKIVCTREAIRTGSDENGDMEVRLSARGREFGIIAAFTLPAVYVASRFTTYSAGMGASRAFVVTVLAVVPLVLARRWPSLAAAAATLLCVVTLRTNNPALSVASFCIVLVLLAHLVTRRGLSFAAPLILPFFVIAVVRIDDANNALGSSAPLLFAVAALAVGESLRRRGLAVAALDATEEAMAESARTQTAMEERARIARELHDIVAHHLSVITIESEAARLTSPELSPDAGSRFEAIASTAREALTETRRLLGVLREDSGVEADRAPQPGLARLDELIDTAQTTGTPVRLIRQGRVAQLAPGIDLAAYRIVQEALTNARRHAPGARVDVELTYRDKALELRVRDYGPGVLGGELVEGHGLMGMRERAALARGTFSAGPSDGDGFAVDVTLPTEAP
jgi:signal transduction histidine kinase